MEALAAKVLHLGDSPGPYDDVRHAELVWLIAAASAAGRNVHNPIALAAFHMELNGMLSPDTLIKTPGSAARGRDWTRKRSTMPLETAYYLRSPDGTLEAASGADASQYTPWNPEKADQVPGGAVPYFVLADGGPDHIDMPWPDGSTRRIPPEEIAELLTRDSWLNVRDADNPIAMVVSNAATGSRGMSKAPARREATARIVFSPTVPAGLHDDPVNGKRVIVVTAGPGQHLDWLRNRPPRLRPSATTPQTSDAASAGLITNEPAVTDAAVNGPAVTDAPAAVNGPAVTDAPTAHVRSDSSSDSIDAVSTTDDSGPADLVTNGTPGRLPDPSADLVMNAGPGQHAPSGSTSQAGTGPWAGPSGTASLTPGTTPLEILPSRSAVIFAEGSSGLDPAESAHVVDLGRRMANAGLRDVLAGLSLFRAKVIVRGGGAEARANAVIGALQGTMRTFLTRAQRDVRLGGRTVDARDFAITADVRDGRSDGADQRNQVTVEVTRPGFSEAVERLDVLRRADSDPAVREGLFDPDLLVRRILHLSANDPVGSGQRRELYAIVNEAMAAGRANSLTELGLYYLVKRGAFTSATRILSKDGKPTGVNWTGSPVKDVETRAYHVREEPDPAQPQRKLQQQPNAAPWRPKPSLPSPYVVVAEGGHDHVMMALPGFSSPRRVPMDEFIALMAMDRSLTGLPANVPLLLVIPGAGAQGLELPRKAAMKLGRTVWAHTRVVKALPTSGLHSEIVVADRRRAKQPVGHWIGARPGDLREEDLEAAKGGSVRTITGEVIPDSEIETTTLALDGNTHGRVAFDDADLTMRESYRHLPQITKFVTADPLTMTPVSAPEDVPWLGRKAYFDSTHGIANAISARVRGGRKVLLDGTQHGAFLKRRPSIRRLTPEDVIVTMVCWADAQADGFPYVDSGKPDPFVYDPLGTVSPAQLTANETAHTVFAVDRPSGLNSHKMFHVIETDPTLRPRKWRELRPEPYGAELDKLAEIAGLHTSGGAASPEVRATTLRLVRALRLTFEVSVENDKDDPAGQYQSLLRGIGALEKLRRAEPGHFGRLGMFRLDLLNRAALSHASLPPVVNGKPNKPTPDAVKALLLAAAVAPSGTKITTSLPSLVGAVQLLRQQQQQDPLGADQRVAKLLSLPANSVVTNAHRERVLWALVEAYEALSVNPDLNSLNALANKVLHVSASAGPFNAARRAELVWLMVSAAVAGRDVHNPAALGAYHLAFKGALSAGTLLLGSRGEVIGRDWTGEGPQPAMETGSFVVSLDGGLDASVSGRSQHSFPGKAAGAGTDPAKPDPFLILGNGEHDYLDMPWPDGSTTRVPADELAELLILDPYLSRRPPNSQVTLLTSSDGGSSLDLATAMSSRTALARPVASPKGSVDRYADPATGKSVIVMTADPAPGTQYWDFARPAPPPSTVAASAAAPVTNELFDDPAGEDVADSVTNSDLDTDTLVDVASDTAAVTDTASVTDTDSVTDSVFDTDTDTDTDSVFDTDTDTDVTFDSDTESLSSEQDLSGSRYAEEATLFEERPGAYPSKDAGTDAAPVVDQAAVKHPASATNPVTNPATVTDPLTDVDPLTGPDTRLGEGKSPDEAGSSALRTPAHDALAAARGPLRVLGRAELTGLVGRVAGRGQAVGLSVERCLVLLGALRDELYTRGVRPAIALDDSVVGRDSAAASLVVGPGWRGVRSWGAVSDAVAAAGPGAAAFVLARRQGDALGHAWAAYNLGGPDGVVWVDVSAGADGQVSALPPAVAASDARAVVIDPAGQAIDPAGPVAAGALPVFAQSDSAVHTVLDAATGRRYGALGLEVEKRQRFVISGVGDVPPKQVLATAPGFKIVTDHARFWLTADGRLHLAAPQLAPGEPMPQWRGYLIGEIVIEPMRVLPGERRQDPEETMARFARVERAFDSRDDPRTAVPMALADLLPAQDGWKTTDLGDKAVVGPTPVRTNLAYVQPTPGMPALGLSVLQDAAVDRLWPGPLEKLEAASRLFGMRATAEFLRRFTGRSDIPEIVVPFFSSIPDVDDIWGYLRFAYAHTVARPVGAMLVQLPSSAFMAKNALAVASRHPMDRIWRALRPRSRDFFNTRHDSISGHLAMTLAKLLEHYRQDITPDKPFFPGFFDATIGDVPSAREHTTSVLTGRTSQGKVVTQKQMVDMDDYPTLDTDDGRLEIPLVLTELRHFAYDSQLMTPEDIRRAVAELSKLSREVYQRALTYRAPLADDVLNESIVRILDNPVVRGLAHFVHLALMAGLPQAEGEPWKLMSTGDSQRIARALGAYALGTPLPDPVHQALRTAVDEAAGLLDTVPPQLQPQYRTLVERAWAALDVLADPALTPPVLPWVSELVALDGSRVLVDRVMVVKHRDADRKPVGVSSRPVQDWQDARRHAYGLLPEAEGFTWVRQGPVPLESPVQPLPFDKAYLVGLRGDAGGAALALSDGTDAVFDYARIVDFLFAVDGDLTALPPESPVLVTGVDLAGPPVDDPLEVPSAGQVLVNGLARWGWATESGLEPVLVPGDGDLGPRLQLVEGDRWVGFRPEPSTAELGRLAERVTGERGRAPDVLRWVRAIRLVYGPMLENDTAAFEALLQGFWALERTRAAHGIQSPLTWRDLRIAIGSHFASNGQLVPPLPVALQFLFLSAAGTMGVDLELSRFSLVPRYQSARAWGRSAAGEAFGGGTAQGEESAQDPADTIDPFTVDTAIADARGEHDDALAAFNEAARTLALLDQRMASGEGNSDDDTRLHNAWEEATAARRRRLDDAVERLLSLGADTAHDAAVAPIVPPVSRTDDERRLIAALVTAEDLPEDPPHLAPDDVVTMAELNALGITLEGGAALQMVLNGSVPVQGSGLKPVDHVRLLMNRPGPWSEALDDVAASASRRT
ncbi:lonely Cys domain-containing protein [Streptomyces sp. LBL]|uniref:lonely Cys domain-containing protein n=1 Tax=Streptomyces sp. LBL TaxID=2940562 RepID=UPI002473D030|nr:lonely Cys domain-containing protein [Streptomyces sp. LBL]